VPVTSGVETTMTGWEYFPQAAELGIRHAWEVSDHTPIMVTENGIATDDDSRRIDYTGAALHCIHAAIADGIDVRGYLHWSALDNFEWASGYRPTFGLIAVDRTTFRRTPKPSLGWLGQVARANAVMQP
jgi:beta-glucosidase